MAMRTSPLVALVVPAIVFLAPLAPRVRAQSETDLQADGWVELFDGSTLNGWTKRGGAATYAVEDGAIVGTTAPDSPNTFLCTDRDYADFELQLEFHVHPELNSGVQIRSLSDPAYEDGRVHGYQVEIDPSERSYTGGIYDESRRGWLFELKDDAAARAAFRQGEWNRMRVVAQGNSIKTWINDVPCADLVDDMTASGFIALQVHGVGERQDPIQVKWKNIRLKPL